jgi:flagellar basal-body rod protein FlgC
MGLFASFDISAAGMNLERTRLDVAAANLANAHTTQTPNGQVFQPLRVVARPVVGQEFDALVRGMGAGAAVASQPFDISVESVNTSPRMVYDPSHPDANQQGFVAYPDINPVSEMVQLIGIGRAYEANVKAMNMAKSMALKALEIGSNA